MRPLGDFPSNRPPHHSLQNLHLNHNRLLPPWRPQHPRPRPDQTLLRPTPTLHSHPLQILPYQLLAPCPVEINPQPPRAKRHRRFTLIILAAERRRLGTYGGVKGNEGHGSVIGGVEAVRGEKEAVSGGGRGSGYEEVRGVDGGVGCEEIGDGVPFFKSMC